MPFRIRTKWGGTLQGLVIGVVFSIVGLRALTAGHWREAIVTLGIASLFIFLLRSAVLWYRFDRDRLTIQQLLRREQFEWGGLQFAAATEETLMMQFGDGGGVTLDSSSISASPKDIFASMEGLWKVNAKGIASTRARVQPMWSWVRALFWWLVIPSLGLLSVPMLTNQTERLGRAMLTLSISVLLLSLTTTTAIYAVSAYSRRQKDRLLTLFRPMLFAMFLVMPFLLAGQAALLAGLLALTTVAVPSLVIAIAISLLLALCELVRSAWLVLRPRPHAVEAIVTSCGEQPEIWKLSDDVAKRLGAPRPEHILLMLEPNYFATEERTNAGRELLEGYSVGLSVPMTRLLTIAELRAVIGHEFGHFRGGDTDFSKKFFPLYAAAIQALSCMAAGYGSWALTPAIYVLHYFVICFGRAESELRRDREYRADQAGAEAASAEDMASALIKLELAGPKLSAAVAKQIYTDCEGCSNFEKDSNLRLARRTSLPLDRLSGVI